MRTMIQRFAALAMALALVFGSVGTVSAGNEDSDQVTASSTTVAALRITVTNGNVVFPALDAYGINPAPAGITKCNLDTPTSTTYATDTPTVVKVISTTGYNVTSAAANGDEDDFVIFLGAQCAASPLTFDEADHAAGDPGDPDPRLSGVATGRAGFSYNVFLGAIISVNEELTQTSTLSFTFRASAVG